MGKLAKLFVLVGLLFCSCTSELPKYKKSPNEFYETYQGREKWLVDSLFYGVRSVWCRAWHLYVINSDSVYPNDSLPHKEVVLFRNDSVFLKSQYGWIYVGDKQIDSLFKPKVIDKRIQAHAKDIINLVEDYGIHEIHLPYDRTGFYVDFCYRGDTAISMQYLENEGWSTTPHVYSVENIKIKN